MNYYTVPTAGKTQAEWMDTVFAQAWVFAGDRSLFPDYATGEVGLEGTLTGQTPVRVVLNNTSPLPDLKAMYTAKTDADTDAIYASVIGERGVEYTIAEDEARAFQAGNYAGAVPPMIATYCAGSGMTPQDATDYTLQLADAWRTAMLAIRQQRTATKTAITAATTQDELSTAMTYWDAFVAAMRSQLGV